MVIWITGLAGSGKTTIAKKVYKILKDKYHHTVLLDGDDFRRIIGSIGYSNEERFRSSHIFHRLSKYLDNEGLIVICSVMALFKEIHRLNRENFSRYIEIFLDVDMDTLIKRDKKSLYSKALKGETKNVVGIDLPWDKPENPEIILKNNSINELENNVKTIINYLKENCRMEI